MNSLEIIRKLQATSGRLEKEAILAEAWKAGNYNFFTLLNMCSDGLISFGVKNIPIKEKNNGNEWLEFHHFHNLAKDLAERQITGHAARDTLISNMEACDADTWNLFYRPVLLKDLRSGIEESTINKVLKEFGTSALPYMIPEFPYQRCCLPKDADLDAFPWKDGVLSQLKSDGMFVNVNHGEHAAVDILSRNGRRFPLEQFAKLHEEIVATLKENTQSHGELLVRKNGKVLAREIGNGILNSVSKGGEFEADEVPVFVIWDQIPLDQVKPKAVVKIPYYERLNSIVEQIDASKTTFIELVENKVVHSLKEAMEHYKEMVALGFEGTIMKDPNSFWKDGTSKHQVKFKVEAECDLKIVGFRPGNGKNEKYFGSIICQSSDGLLEVAVSGFKDKKQPGIPTREEIHLMRDELLGTIMTVRSNTLMKPTGNNDKYSLFLPRFVEFRRDKTVADDLQKVKDQFDSALENM
jgi:DNA ligase-1